MKKNSFIAVRIVFALIIVVLFSEFTNGNLKNNSHDRFNVKSKKVMLTVFKFTVSGKITNSLDVPIAKTAIKVYDRRASGDFQLGEAITDANGMYSASFNNDQQASPNLLVKVVDSKGNVLGESAVVNNVQTNTITTINVKTKPTTAPTKKQ